MSIKKTEECNPGRKSNVLIAFDNMIADMISNKKLNPLVTESEIFFLFLSHNYISKYHKVLDKTVHIFLKFLTNESLSKTHFIIH